MIEHLLLLAVVAVAIAVAAHVVPRALATRWRAGPDQGGAVVTSRFARALFGAVMLGGTASLVRHLSAPEPRGAWILVTATWLAATAVYRLARRWPVAATQPDRFAVLGLVLPSVGIALLLPITIHMPFALAMGAGTQVFDEWAKLSLQLVGPTHLALALLVAIRALQLVRRRRALSPATIFFATVLVSCVPGIVWFGIPPIVVALTGLPFPILMRSMQHIAEREHDVSGVPVARVV